MITHTIDVESLLGQYDPGMILVGPLLSLSMSSSYRYFYVAGNGSKVCETIALGFVDVETTAQTQRADFIEKLESRFAEVLTFGTHLEMAHAVHTRWPNEETAEFLAFAELKTKPEPTEVADQQESINEDGSYAGVAPDDYGKQPADDVAPEPVERVKGIDDNLTHVPPWARDQIQPMPVLRPAQTLVPSQVPIAQSQPLRDDRAVTARQRHSGLSEDDIASAILRLKSPAELGVVTRLPVDRSLASIMLRFCAVGCSVALVAALVAWAIVRPSTRQVADEAAQAPIPTPSISVSRNNHPSRAEPAIPPSDQNYVTEVKEPTPQAEPTPATVPPSPPSQISVSRNNDPSQAEAAVPPSVQNQLTKTNEPAPQAEPMPATTVPPSPPSQISVSRNNDPSQAEAAVPPSVQNQLTKTNEPAPQAEPMPATTVPPSPPSQPLQVASAPTRVAPISGPQSPPAQAGGTTMRLDAEEIATLVTRGTDFLKSGDLASARLLLRRAAEAGSASAALMLGTTFDPLAIRQLGAFGVVPDVAQARQWYEKAAALGSEGASERLAKLAHTGQ